MKHAFVFLLLLMCCRTYAQREGQDFCKGYDKGSYFPLDIVKKKLTWYDSSYHEEFRGTKEMNGHSYNLLKQEWPDGKTDTLYLREDKGRIYQYYPEKGTEILRLDTTLPVESSWSTPNCKYTIISYEAKLLTSYCLYENLLELRAEYEKVTYHFYSLKGYGYVAATKDGKIISYVTPYL